MMQCPLRNLANHLLDGADNPFAEPISEQLALHIEHCTDCQQHLERELNADSLVIRPLVASPISGYRILKLLGHGGHASVYLALELSTERQVALKIIPKLTDQARRGQDIWRQEILLAAQMTHPNLVRLYSVQETPSAFALVFEYIAGGTLNQAISQLTSPAEIQHLLKGIAHGLAAIHAKGILHLDLKPSNILIDQPSRSSPLNWIPKISDFGIARKYSHVGPSVISSSSDTRSGSTPSSLQPIGTIEYMAPEQTLTFPELLGPSTDLFGLGGILQKMLDHIAADPRSACDLRSDLVFLRLRKIARRCLEIDPALRYPTANALLKELEPSGQSTLKNDIFSQVNAPADQALLEVDLPQTSNPFSAFYHHLFPNNGPLYNGPSYNNPLYNTVLKFLLLPLIVAAGIYLSAMFLKAPNATNPSNFKHPQDDRSEIAQWIADLDLHPQAITPTIAMRLEQRSDYWTKRLLSQSKSVHDQSEILHYAILQRSAAERLAAYVDTCHIPLGRQLLSQAIEITASLHARSPEDQAILREHINATFCAGILNQSQEDIQSYDAFMARRLVYIKQTIALLPRLIETKLQWNWTAKILDELRRSRQLADWGKLSNCLREIEQTEAFALNELKPLLEKNSEPVPFEINLRFQLAAPQSDAFATLKTLLESPVESNGTTHASWQQPNDRDSIRRYLLVKILGDTVFQAGSESELAMMEPTVNRLLVELKETQAEPNQIPSTVHEELIRFVAGISSYARADNNIPLSESIQRRYLSLCLICQNHFPNHPSVYVALSEAHLQAWKNHLRRDESELAVAALMRSHASAQQGLDIDPNHPLAYHQVTDRLKRLARFRNE